MNGAKIQCFCSVARDGRGVILHLCIALIWTWIFLVPEWVGSNIQNGPYAFLLVTSIVIYCPLPQATQLECASDHVRCSGYSDVRCSGVARDGTTRHGVQQPRTVVVMWWCHHVAFRLLSFWLEGGEDGWGVIIESSKQILNSVSS